MPLGPGAAVLGLAEGAFGEAAQLGRVAALVDAAAALEGLQLDLRDENLLPALRGSVESALTAARAQSVRLEVSLPETLPIKGYFSFDATRADVVAELPEAAF